MQNFLHNDFPFNGDMAFAGLFNQLIANRFERQYGEADIVELSDEENCDSDEKTSQSQEDILADLCDDISKSLNVASGKLRNISRKGTKRNVKFELSDAEIEKRIQILVIALKSEKFEDYLKQVNEVTESYPVIKGKPDYAYRKAHEYKNKGRIAEAIVFLHLVGKTMVGLPQIHREKYKIILSCCSFINEWSQDTNLHSDRIAKVMTPRILKDVAHDLEQMRDSDENWGLTSAACYFIYSLCLLRLKNYIEAIKELKSTTKLFEKVLQNEQFKNEFTITVCMLQICTGLAYLHLHQFEESLSFYEKAKESLLHCTSSERAVVLKFCEDGIKACKQFIEDKELKSGFGNKVTDLKKIIIASNRAKYVQEMASWICELKKLNHPNLGALLFNHADELAKKGLETFIMFSVASTVILSSETFSKEDLVAVEVSVAKISEATNELCDELEVDSQSFTVDFVAPAINTIITGLRVVKDLKQECNVLIAVCYKAIADLYLKNKMLEKSISSFEDGIKIMKMPDMREVAPTSRIFGMMMRGQSHAYLALRNVDKARTLLCEAIKLLKQSTDWESDDAKAKYIKETEIALAGITLYC